MYRIGELARVAEVTPDTIRYYEKQQMTEYEVRTEGGFRLRTESDLQRLKFIRYAKQLSFSLGSVRELLSTHTDPGRHTCQGSRGIMQERSREVETRIAELQSIQRSSQCFNDTCCGTAHNSVYCSILEVLEQGASGVKSGCWFFALIGLHSCR